MRGTSSAAAAAFGLPGARYRQAMPGLSVLARDAGKAAR